VFDPFKRATANGVWPALLRAAGAGPGDFIIGANIAYDFACIAATVPEALPVIWDWYEQRRIFDIQIAATLNAIAEGRLDDGELRERSGRRAIVPSSFMISQITAAGVSPARAARSHPASVCPARMSTPPSCACSARSAGL
jgi:hypothetical protein